MRAAVFCFLVGCTARPPPIGDSDAAKVPSVGVPSDAGVIDTGSDSGESAFYTDYEGACSAGAHPVWRFHDFQTKTPKDSAIVFSAQSAAALLDFKTQASVELARVTGPDITVWAGVDVDPRLKTKGEQSLRYLRVKTSLVSGSDGTPPTLVATRQQFDCVTNQ